MRTSACSALPRPQQIFIGRLARPIQTSRWLRPYSQPAGALHSGPSRTRNIGIIAHIDAGKTTTTERMLFYSGNTSRIGDVDDGSTVTDFLPAERARGITIQSAAVTLKWPPHGRNVPQRASGLLSETIHDINLIDTPGHADFTFEVLRSLRVLDGAICILDGVAGVEAQTEIVWSQADHYQIPKLIFVNKLDRTGASFSKSVREIASKLRIAPALCQIPYWDEKSRDFCGVGDAVSLRTLRWRPGSDGRNVLHQSLSEIEASNQSFANEIRKARVALVELLAEHDEAMVEEFLNVDEDHMAIKPTIILRSLRRCVLQSPQLLVPVYAGASFRNIGVQPMMDAVVDLLPSPEERPDPDITVSSQNDTLGAFLTQAATQMQSGGTKKVAKYSADKVQSCSLAFKVVHDAKRGVLVFVRVYQGRLEQGAALFNTTLNMGERAGKLLRMFASDATEVDAIETGHIGVIVGLKHTRTGDTLVAYSGMNWKTGPPSPVDSLQLRPIAIPPPVFFASIEPASPAEEKPVMNALEVLLREDPSLHVNRDEETGQTHLSGMGELHLEIACDRLIKDLRAKATVGQIEIGYRESISGRSQEHAAMVEQDVNGKMSRAGCLALVEPRSAEVERVKNSKISTRYQLADNNRLFLHLDTLDPGSRTDDSAAVLSKSTLHPRSILSALQSGAVAGLAKGPTYSFPMHTVDVHIVLNAAEHIFQDTTVSTLAVAARRAVRAALKELSQTEQALLLEPVMLVTISVNEDALGAVVRDLTSIRGGTILSLGDDNDAQTSISDSGEAREGVERAIDLQNVYTPPDLYAADSDFVNSDAQTPPKRQIMTRVPLKEMVGYLKHLRSLTGGRGTFLMQVDQFEPVRGQRLKNTVTGLRGW